MSGVPPELRDYVEPLVRVGHVTVTVYERCIQEAVRLGLSETEGDAYLRRLAEEHDAILEAPPRPEFAATAAWEPAPSTESSEDDPTKADVLDNVPSDSEERAALEAARVAETDPELDALADLSESAPDEPAPDQTEVDPAPAEPDPPAVSETLPTPTPSAAEVAKTELMSGIGDAAEVATQGAPAQEVPDETAPVPAAESESPLVEESESRAVALPTGGFCGIPWLHLTPIAIAPLLAALILMSGGIEAAQSRFGGGDPFEPNNSFAEAKLLTPGKHTGITLLRDDVDWFKIQVEEGRGLLVSYENLPNEAAISLHDGSGARLERVGESVGELVYVPKAGKSEEVYLALSGSARELILIEISQIDPRQRFEENDVPGLATEVDAGQVASLTCDGSDWFRLVVPEHRPVNAKVTGGLGVRVLEAGDRAGLASAALNLPAEAKLGAVGLPRAVLVQVVGRGDYTLDLNFGERDLESAKRAGDLLQTFTDTLEPNNRRQQAAQLEPGYYPKLRCDSKDYYLVKVPANHSLILDWRGSPSLSFPTIRSRIFGNDLDSQGASDGSKRQVFFTKRAMEVLVLAQGRGDYALTCRVTPGLPGRELAPGSYPEIRGRGDDLFWLVAEPEDKLDLDFDVGRSDRYGRQIEVLLIRVPLKQDKDKPSTRRRGKQQRNTRTEYISDRELISQRFFERELVFVRVRGARRPYSLDVELSRAQSKGGVGGYRPPVFEVVGPGTYVGRVVERGVYGVDLMPGDRLEARVSFSSQQGDLDVELLDSYGEMIEDSTGSGDEEQVACVSKVKQRVYLFVRDLSGVETVYDLEIKLNDETLPAKDTPTIQKGLHPGLVCNRETVLKIAVTAGQMIRAKIKFDDAKGELDLGLLDEAGVEQARATEIGPSEALSHVVEATGHVFLRVSGEGKRFDLELAIQEP